MADVTISSLTNKLPGSSAVFPYSEGGVTYNATLNQIIPTGVIMMWSGSIATVPSGWGLCDGTGGKPDLRDRFIVGAGRQYSVTNTGGLSSVKLTIAEMPKHNHTMVGGYDGYPLQAYNPSYPVAGIYGYSSWKDWSEGGDQAHENRPPYYALAYIIKL